MFLCTTQTTKVATASNVRCLNEAILLDSLGIDSGHGFAVLLGVPVSSGFDKCNLRRPCRSLQSYKGDMMAYDRKLIVLQIRLEGAKAAAEGKPVEARPYKYMDGYSGKQAITGIGAQWKTAKRH
jgi:hypothetical protein